MRRIKITAALFVAVSLFFSVANFLPAFADPVTIHGQRLAEISDIVKTVTSSDFPEIQKHSLLFFERLTEDSEVVYQPRVFTINNDGSMKKEHVLDAQHLDDRHKTRQTLYPGGDVVQKMDLAISPKRFGMRRNVIYTNSGLVPDSGYYSVTGFQTVESNGVEDAASMTTPTEEAPQWYWGERCMWGNAAMTIKGMEDKDIYVIAHSTTMAQTGDISLYFLGVDRNESGSLSSHHITVNGGNQYFGAKAFDFNNGIRGVDVAAGDFDGDGYKNEILLAWNNNDGVFAYVYRITTEDGETLNSGGMMPITEPIHTGVQSWGLDYTHQSSVVALAGDFDGDGVEEAAVVTRTNGLNLTDMRVKVFKYNSGSWISGELTAYSDFLGTLKATKADLNGDGQDEIVILVIQDSGGTLYPRLEFWGFNHGSIEPVRAWGCNKGGAGNTSLLGYSIGGNEYNQSFKTAEDFCITAGPLTGTKGHVKLAEDIIISHVDEYASRVFVIPPVLNTNRDFIAFGETKKIYEDTTVDSARRGGVITSDFANESLMLGEPHHTQDDHDESYVALLQALPYHVDNIDYVNGELSLSNKPKNYTFSGFGDMADGIAGQMRVAYSSTRASEESKSASFGLASTTETVSLLGDAGKYAAGYLKFRATEANIAGNFDPRIKAAAAGLNTLMDFVTDKIDTTTTNASTSATKVTLKEGFDARQFDRFVTYSAPQHIWRYKILNKPLPSWYVLGPKADYVSRDFDTESKDHYMTFSMYDEATPAGAGSDTHSGYQARHEEGNFFSYPSTIEDIDGYTAGGALISSPYRAAWAKSKTGMAVKFEQSKIDSQTYDEHVKKSELTKTVSAIASFFGAKDPDPLPPYTSHSEAFVKKYSSSETISIDVYGRTSLPGESASHTLMAMPYTTREGTMKVGTAVSLINYGYQDSPALWSTKSPYYKYPDPALVLPFKYKMLGATLVAANQISASKARGLRFYIPSLDLDSDFNILGGLQYKISVPVYNASFLDADDFQVSLSYVSGYDSEFDLAYPNRHLANLKHIQTITMSLKGWQNGSRLNKGWAEFTWDVPENLYKGDGTYYFYIQINPGQEGKQKPEVHKSRMSGDSVVDVGGNNEGYFRFNFSSPGTLQNRQTAQASGTFKAAAHSGNGTIFQTAYRSGESNGGFRTAATIYDTTGSVSINAKLLDEDMSSLGEGLEGKEIEILEVLGFLEELAGIESSDYVPLVCQLTYSGEEYYPEAYFYAVNYKPGALDSVSGDRSKLSSSAISERFIVEKLPLVPGKTTSFLIHIHPGDVDWINGAGFQLVVPELASSESSSSGGSDGSGDSGGGSGETSEGVSSSSGGCGAVTGSLAMMIFAGAMIFRKARRK